MQNAITISGYLGIPLLERPINYKAKTIIINHDYWLTYCRVMIVWRGEDTAAGLFNNVPIPWCAVNSRQDFLFNQKICMLRGLWDLFVISNFTAHCSNIYVIVFRYLQARNIFNVFLYSTRWWRTKAHRINF